MQITVNKQTHEFEVVLAAAIEKAATGYICPPDIERASKTTDPGAFGHALTVIRYFGKTVGHSFVTHRLCDPSREGIARFLMDEIKRLNKKAEAPVQKKLKRIEAEKRRAEEERRYAERQAIEASRRRAAEEEERKRREEQEKLRREAEQREIEVSPDLTGQYGVCRVSTRTDVYFVWFPYEPSEKWFPTLQAEIKALAFKWDGSDWQVSRARWRKLQDVLPKFPAQTEFATAGGISWTWHQYHSSGEKPVEKAVVRRDGGVYEIVSVRWRKDYSDEWECTARAVPASGEKLRRFEAEEARRRGELQAEAAIRRLEREIREKGVRDDEAEIKGFKCLDTRNLYGGTCWYVGETTLFHLDALSDGRTSVWTMPRSEEAVAVLRAATQLHGMAALNNAFVQHIEQGKVEA